MYQPSAGFEPSQQSLALLALFTSGEDGDTDAGRFRERCDGLVVLTRENFGRSHQCRLAAGFRHRRGGEQGDHRLAGADVTLQQPQHSHRLRQVVGDGRDRLLL